MNRYQRGEARTDVEFSLRIPTEIAERLDSDHPDFITPRRARLIRLDIETQRALAAADAALADEELPAGAKEGGGDDAASPGAEGVRYPHPGRGPAGTRAQAPAPAPVRASRCTFYTDAAGYCGATPARRFRDGWRCVDHSPSAAPVPDPSRTAEALRRRRELAMRALRAGAARNAARVLYALAHVA